MGVNIHLKPTEVWPFFKANTARVEKELIAIAENEDTDYTVYLTEESGCPLLSVYKEDKKLYEEGAVSASDCEDTAKRLYLKYLFPVVINNPKFDIGSEDETEPEMTPEEEMQFYEDAIYEREDELSLAMSDFLEILLNCSDPVKLGELYGESIVEDILDSICKMLAEEHLISVYRPTWIDDEFGVSQFVEYPYLEVDDEDNGGALLVTRK